MVARTDTTSEPFPIVCLGCGSPRVARRTATTNLDIPICPACGYVGWRESSDAELLSILARGISLD